MFTQFTNMFVFTFLSALGKEAYIVIMSSNVCKSLKSIIFNTKLLYMILEQVF